MDSSEPYVNSAREPEGRIGCYSTRNLGSSPNKPHAFPRYRIKRGSQILSSLYMVYAAENAMVY